METELNTPEIKRSKIKITLVMLVVLLASSSVAGFFIIKSRASSPVPDTIRSSVNFPIYIPKSIPLDYRVDKRSFRYESGILFFEIKNSEKVIYMSEQEAPTKPPELDLIVERLGFKEIDLLNGSAVVGVEMNNPRVVFLSNTTLINMNSGSEIPLETLIEILRSLYPI